MTVAVLGEIEIGAAIPGAVAALDLAVPQLQAQIDALLAFNPGEIDFGAQLTIALQIVADIQAAITLGITPPSISAQIAIVLALLAPLQANLAAIAAFKALLSAKLFAYAYTGPTNAFGTELQAQLSGGFPGGHPTDQTWALVLGTNVNATYTAMGGVFVSF